MRELANEKRNSYSSEVRERAFRMILTSEHEHPSSWAAPVSIPSKIGCTPEPLRARVNKVEVDSDQKSSLTSGAAVKIKELERENKDLKQASEILNKAATFFAQAELDRKPRKKMALLQIF